MKCALVWFLSPRMKRPSLLYWFIVSFDLILRYLEGLPLLLLVVLFVGFSLRGTGPATGVCQCIGPWRSCSRTYELFLGLRAGFLQLSVLPYGRSDGWRLRLRYQRSGERGYLYEVCIFDRRIFDLFFCFWFSHVML